MCKSLWMYPLIKLKDDKQKLLFDYGVNVKNREEYDYLTNGIRKDFKYGNLVSCNIKSLNNIVHDPDYKEFVKMVNVPCGSCSECLKDRSRQWALRILKEAEQYEENYFITFTYNDDNLPIDRNLVQDEISRFNKKLKTYLNRENLRSDFRFYGVGEYGSNTARPHYHVIYFNLHVPDLEFYKVGESGELYFTSKFLENVWSKGFVVVGTVDVGSASYVARYCDKKRMLSKQEKERLIEKGIVPEFSVMSRRPGIGANYLDVIENNIKNGVYTIPIKENNYSIPLYYSKKIKELLPDDVLVRYEQVKTLNQNIKIHNDLLESDIVEDLEVVRYNEDKDKLQKKKKRLDL